MAEKLQACRTTVIKNVFQKIAKIDVFDRIWVTKIFRKAKIINMEAKRHSWFVKAILSAKRYDLEIRRADFSANTTV